MKDMGTLLITLNNTYQISSTKNTQRETERLNQKPQNPIRITMKQVDKRLSNSLENNGNAQDYQFGGIFMNGLDIDTEHPTKVINSPQCSRIDLNQGNFN